MGKKRLNPETGEPFRKGDLRSDGRVFMNYTVLVKKNGYLGECWLKPESYERIKASDRERAKIYRDGTDASQKYHRNREASLKSRYGITLDRYEAMRMAQGGRCAICQEPTEKLVVDHCHESGKVRALLCHPCNILCGFLEKRKHNLEQAHRYIEVHKALTMPELWEPGCPSDLLGPSVVLQMSELRKPRRPGA